MKDRKATDREEHPVDEVVVIEGTISNPMNPEILEGEIGIQLLIIGQSRLVPIRVTPLCVSGRLLIFFECYTK